MKKKIGELFFAVILCFLAVTGCGPAGTEEAAGTEETGKIKVVLTTGFGRDEIFRIESASCSVPEQMV